ncbi:hypothetical protein ACJX0J_009813, partial [Zea mays]
WLKILILYNVFFKIHLKKTSYYVKGRLGGYPGTPRYTIKSTLTTFAYIEEKNYSPNLEESLFTSITHISLYLVIGWMVVFSVLAFVFVLGTVALFVQPNPDLQTTLLIMHMNHGRFQLVVATGSWGGGGGGGDLF